MGVMAVRLAPLDYDPQEPVIEAIRSGDRYAFSELVRQQGRWVRGVAFGVLGTRDQVDDVVQQVWMVVWQQIAELRDVRRWRPWLYRIVRNAAIDAGREATRKREQKEELVKRARKGATGAKVDRDEAADGERYQAVLDAIRALPAMYREPFVLRHINDWNYRQIAEVMGMPVDSVETRLVRARRFLREALKNDLDSSG